MAREFWINMFLAPSTNGVAFTTEQEADRHAEHSTCHERIHVVEAPPRKAEGPFCKDCKHFNHKWDASPECLRSGVIEPVYGKRRFSSCGVMRKPDVGRCGPEGAWFEQWISVWTGKPLD